MTFFWFHSQDWIECRLNAKPDPNSSRKVQLNVYPKLYDEMGPYFSIGIDHTKIRCGTIKSRSKANTYGILWSWEGKKCRIFIAFESIAMHRNFSKYFRKLLKFFNLPNDSENGK